jgi:hypothetical protein
LDHVNPLSWTAAVAAALLMTGSAAYAAVGLRPSARARTGRGALTALAVCWGLALVLVAVAIGARLLA